jgi:predicted O-methyltransferase YrrM
MIRAQAARVGDRLSTRLGRSFARGNSARVPAWTWALAPGRVREWVTREVLRRAEERAGADVSTHPLLGPLRLPSSNSFSLSDLTRLAFAEVIDLTSPRRVIELGSGVSTLIFAAAMMRRAGAAENGPSIVSIDHDSHWLDETGAMLRAAGLDRAVRLVHAPIVECAPHGHAYGIPHATLREVAGEEGFDLCMIDGPPSRYGRAPCLPLVAPFLAPRATVLLDDSLRRSELMAWRQWQKTFPGTLRRTRLILTDRGLLIGEWSRPNGRLPA